MSFPRPRSIAANAIDSQQSHDNVELRSMAEKANAYRYYTLKDVWNAMKYEKKINFYFWMSILLGNNLTKQVICVYKIFTICFNLH